MTPEDIVTKKDLDQLKQELFDFLRPIVDAQGLQQQKWLRSKDVTKLLNISTGTLQNLRVNGMLGYRKAGSIFFYKAEDIDKMLADPEKKSPKRKL
jgi:hypothetical protein